MEGVVRRLDGDYRWALRKTGTTTANTRLRPGFLAPLPRKNCWTIAEHAGDVGPAGLIPLTVNELRHLFNKLVIDPTRRHIDPLLWSKRRRRHQARGMSSHYARQAPSDYPADWVVRLAPDRTVGVRRGSGAEGRSSTARSTMPNGVSGAGTRLGTTIEGGLRRLTSA
jgi:hypothetical protein